MKRIDPAGWDDNCRNIRAISTTGAITMASYCHWTQMGELATAMGENNFKNVKPFYWYKEGLIVMQGTGYCNAVETMVIGTASTATVSQTYFSKNPLLRHNFHQGKTLAVRTKDEKGNVVNPCEKPTHPVKGIIRNYTSPASTVLVLCAGMGGEVKACIEEGLDVVGVEKDPVQFKLLCAMMTTWDADLKMKADKEAKLAAAKAKKTEGEAQAARRATRPGAPPAAMRTTTT